MVPQGPQAFEELTNGNPQTAAELFESKPWQAAALYRAGDYENAAKVLDRCDSPVAHYNRGNSLALTGNYDAAIEEYQIALQQDPGLQDAQYNLELIKKLQEQQHQSDSDQNQSDKKKIKKIRIPKTISKINHKITESLQQDSEQNESREKPQDQSPSNPEEQNSSSSDPNGQESSESKNSAGRICKIRRAGRSTRQNKKSKLVSWGASGKEYSVRR